MHAFVNYRPFHPPITLATRQLRRNNLIAEGAPDVADGEWHHAAIVYDPTAPATHRMRLYLDGSIADQEPVDYPPHPDSHDRYLTIGVHSSNQEPGVWFFEGGVDEVVVYDRPLSASEIQGIFSAGSWGRPMPMPITPKAEQCEQKQTPGVSRRSGLSVALRRETPAFVPCPQAAAT